MPASSAAKKCDNLFLRRTIVLGSPTNGRQSLRLPNCDYGSPGQYFVTICTSNRACVFGEIIEGAMRLSREGTIAEAAWRNLPAHHRHLALDAFVIMPNHLHGILLFQAPGAALGTVIGGFKSEVSRLLRRPMWQRYYYDHVIRSREGLDRIRSYIEKNPFCWPEDDENPGVRNGNGKRRASPPPTIVRCPLPIFLDQSKTSR